MPNEEVPPRAPRQQDVSALIGLLATLEGELMIEDRDAVPHWARRFAERLARDGLLAPASDRHQLRPSATRWT